MKRVEMGWGCKQDLSFLFRKTDTASCRNVFPNSHILKGALEKSRKEKYATLARVLNKFLPVHWEYSLLTMIYWAYYSG